MCAKNSVHKTPVDPGKQFFSLSELNQLVDQENSCVSVVTSKRCISLMPHHLKNLSASIKELLSAKVSKYDVQLEGVILAHKNIKLIANSFKLSDCYSFPLEFVADIYLFKPKVGSRLRGIVNKITNEYMNILVHRTFNVTVYSSGRGWTTEIGSQVEVEVTALDYTSQLPYIKASLIFPGYDEPDEGDATKVKKKKSKDREPQTSLIGISQRDEPSSLIRVSQRKELVSILKNSPLRMLRQSSTEVEMESQEAESSSTESSKARTKENPAVQAGIEEGKAKKKKEKKKKKSKSNDIDEGEKSSRKRKRDEEPNESASSSKKSKKRKHKDKPDEPRTAPKPQWENTTQILPNDSIFQAASSTPVLAPSPKKKKRKLSGGEDPKQSALIESLLQLKMEEMMTPMDTSKTKSKKPKIKVEPEVDVGNHHNKTSVVESESSNGRKKKKKKKDHKDKTDEDSSLSHALKRLKKEV